MQDRVSAQRGEQEPTLCRVPCPGSCAARFRFRTIRPCCASCACSKRRTGRSGKDVVDHGRNGSDDFANSVAGLLYLLAADNSEYDESMNWVTDYFAKPGEPDPSGRPPVCGTSCLPEEAEASDDMNSKRGASDMTSKTKDDDRRQEEVLKDGEVLTVRVHHDGVAAAGHRRGTAALDAAGHRPGYVMLSDAERERRAALYRDHKERLSARWKGAPPTASRPTQCARRATRDLMHTPATRIALRTHGGEDEPERKTSRWTSASPPRSPTGARSPTTFRP